MYNKNFTPPRFNKSRVIFVLCSLLFLGAQQVQAQYSQEREIRWFSNGNGTRGDDGEDPGGGTGVPIGSGVAILLGLGAGYACVKRHRKE